MCFFLTSHFSPSQNWCRIVEVEHFRPEKINLEAIKIRKMRPVGRKNFRDADLLFFNMLDHNRSMTR